MDHGETNKQNNTRGRKAYAQEGALRVTKKFERKGGSVSSVQPRGDHERHGA